jgi:Protein of unknown function DUF45
VRISAPARMKLDTIRVFAISKLGWIKQQQKKLRGQQRETPREYLDRESHYVWGKRYLLRVMGSHIGVWKQSAIRSARRQEIWSISYDAYQKPEGQITEVSCMWVRPGPDQTQVQKVSFATRVSDDLGCGVGYYK